MDRVISQKIDSWLDDPTFTDVILLIGMRRVGKTTELSRLKRGRMGAMYFDLEDVSVQRLFVPEVAKLARIVGETNLLLLDEIQYLAKSGSVLKLLHDHFPKLRIVVTGSASFLLLKNIGDSLQGRFRQLTMFPLTFREVCGDLQSNFVLGHYDQELHQSAIDAHLEEFMLYGSLPQVYTENLLPGKRERLEGYLNGLLFKDVLEIEGIRNPAAFKQLLSLLALQIGAEVNPNELAATLGINRRTVVEYISLFEKFQILYRLTSFSTNQRKEVGRNFKVYFSDLGVRNVVIGNFSDLTKRTDTGGIFENLSANVMRQNLGYYNTDWTMHFWRNTARAEVDLVLVSKTSSEIIPIETKFNKASLPSRAFVNLYKPRVKRVFGINKSNFWKFI